MRVLAIGLAFVCVSCSLLGSRGSFIHQPSKKIKRVAVLIVQDINHELQVNETEGFVFTKTLAEELATAKTFDFKILERQFDFTSFDRLLTSSLAKDLENSFDAFIICHPKQKGLNYKVELVLVETGMGHEIIRASHSTAMGNSYWWYQSPHETLIDATKGAIDVLTNKFKKRLF